MFACSVCAKPFAFAANARRHERNVHVGPPAASTISTPTSTPTSNPSLNASSHDISVVMAPVLAMQRPIVAAGTVPLRAAPWRCCATCGLTFRTLDEKNTHARQCEGAISAKAITERHNEASELLARWQDADSDMAPDRHASLAPDVTKDMSSFDQWVQSPAGYGSIGAGRAVNSVRTVQIIGEDLRFLLSHMTIPTLQGFCDPKQVCDMMTKVVSLAKSASRMYNLTTAAEKVSVTC